MFSFSQQVKKEISTIGGFPRHCAIAETSAIINHLGAIVPESQKEPHGEKLVISTENVTAAIRAYKILKSVSGEKPETEIKKISKSANLYAVSVKNLKICLSAGLLKNGVFLRTIDPVVLKSECCKRAFIRAAFLCSGSVSSPYKGYHFEITHTDPEYLNKLESLIVNLGSAARITKRKSHYVLYIKESEQIVNMLGIMGAHISMMEMEDSRIYKTLMNDVTRTVNCETANIKKITAAAANHISDIRFLQTSVGLSALSDSLREVATARMNYPEASLKELGEMLEKPIGKSGVNHRLRKISELADFYRN